MAAKLQQSGLLGPLYWGFLVGLLFYGDIRHSETLPIGLALVAGAFLTLWATNWIHGAGHRLAGRLRGFTLQRGGNAGLTNDVRPDRAIEKPIDQIVIWLGGPLASVLTTAALVALCRTAGWPVFLGGEDDIDAAAALRLIVQIAIFLNGLLAIWTALPFLPLDGAQVVLGVFWAILRDPLRAVTPTLIVGAVAAACGVSLGLLAFVVLASPLAAVIVGAPCLLIYFSASYTNAFLSFYALRASTYGGAIDNVQYVARPALGVEPARAALLAERAPADADVAVLDDAGRCIGLVRAADLVYADGRATLADVMVAATADPARPDAHMLPARKQLREGYSVAVADEDGDRYRGLVTPREVRAVCARRIQPAMPAFLVDWLAPEFASPAAPAVEPSLRELVPAGA